MRGRLRKPGEVSENTVKSWIRETFKRHGVWWYANAPGPFGGAGVDFLGVHRGRFLAVEAKRPGEKPRPRQEATLNAIRRAGGFAFVVSDKHTLEELKLWLAT